MHDAASTPLRDPVLLGPYAALGHRFTVDVRDPVLATEVARVLAPLTAGKAPSTAAPLHRYVVRPGVEGLELWSGDERIEAGPTRAHVLAMLLWDVNRSAVAAPTGHLVLHAGAVVGPDGRAVVLPAAMEAGKTTLVTGLVRDGFGYMSDELAVVATDHMQVLAYPKVLSLDPGSWPLFPELAPAPGRHRVSPTQWLVDAEEVRAGATHREPAPLGAVVLPRHVPGAATSLTRLRPADALQPLASTTFGFDRHAPRVLPRLAAVLDAVPAFALVVGDGVAGVANLVTGALAATGTSVTVGNDTRPRPLQAGEHTRSQGMGES